MNRLKISAPLGEWVTRIRRHEQGSSIIELAIVFPILLLLFVGAAELGRLFYTYTTLSKATAVGARYLSTSRNAVNGTATEKANARTEAKNLVVCGIKSSAENACDNETKVVPGLTTANVLICDNISTPCTPPLGGSLLIKYFRVEIQDYNYAPDVLNLSTMSGGASSSIYFALKPGTETRWMQ